MGQAKRRGDFEARKEQASNKPVVKFTVTPAKIDSFNFIRRCVDNMVREGYLDPSNDTFAENENYKNVLVNMRRLDENGKGNKISEAIILQVDGENAGFLIYTKHDRLLCELWLLYVMPEYRHIGAGKYFIDDFLKKITKLCLHHFKGIPDFRVRVNFQSNELLQILVKKHNFIVLAQGKKYYQVFRYGKDADLKYDFDTKEMQKMGMKVLSREDVFSLVYNPVKRPI